MNKKFDINELDIPVDDIDAWNRYPKHRWVYDVPRLLETQNIKWSPFKTVSLDTEWVSMSLKSNAKIDLKPMHIFIEFPSGASSNTEVYINKGEIKLLRHIDCDQKEIIGEIELRINAFVTLHFQKFTGVISVLSFGSDIYQIALRPHSALDINANDNVIKLIKRIYKKHEIQLEMC